MRKLQGSQKALIQEPPVRVPAGCVLTEYQDRFPVQRCCIDTVTQHKDHGHTLEMVKTTFRRSEHGTPEATQKPPNISKPYHVTSEDHVTCTSTYAADYPPRRAERHIVTPAWNYCPPTAKMFLQSLYKDDYQAWGTHRSQPNKLRDNLQLSGKFATTTTFRDAYCKVRESFKQQGQMSMRQTPPHLDRDGTTTTYRRNYITHPVERKPREKPTYQPSSDPLTRVYTSRHDYKGLPTEAAKSFKPKVVWGTKNPEAFFDSSGVQFNDHQHKTRPVEPKFHNHFKPEGYIPSPDIYLSTAHADYNAHKCRRPESARRPDVHAWLDHNEPFQARSTMQEDFKNWSIV